MPGSTRNDRRSFLKITSALGVSGALGGVAQTADAQQKTIVFNDSGGASAKAADVAFGIPFEAETGNKLVVTAPAEVAKLQAMVLAKNVEWDVAELVSQEHRLAIRKGLLQPLDKALVDTSNLTPDGFDDYSVAFALYSTAMFYNKVKIPEAKRPKNWRDFWDVANFPGRRALRNHPVDNLEFALLADGVPPDKLYPLNLDRAFASLNKIKPHIAVWWKDGAQPAQLLQDGEVDFTSGWHGRFFALANQGEKRIGVEWKEAMLKRSWVGVPVGAKNPKEAMKLVAIMINPKNSAKYAEGIAYICSDPRALQYLPENVKAWVVTVSERRSQMVVANEDWWLDNLETAQRRWNEWIAT